MLRSIHKSIFILFVFFIGPNPTPFLVAKEEVVRTTQNSEKKKKAFIGLMLLSAFVVVVPGSSLVHSFFPIHHGYCYRYDEDQEALHVTHTYKRKGKVYCISTYTIKKGLDITTKNSIKIKRTYPEHPAKDEILELKRIDNTPDNCTQLVDLVKKSEKHLEIEPFISNYYYSDKKSASNRLKEIKNSMDKDKSKFFLGIFHKKASEKESKIIGETGLYREKLYGGAYIVHWVGDPKSTGVKGVAGLCTGALQDLFILNDKFSDMFFDKVFYGIILKKNAKSNRCARRILHRISAEKKFKNARLLHGVPAKKCYLYTLYPWERIQYFWGMDPRKFGYEAGS